MAVTIASIAVTLRLITDPEEEIPAGTQMILEHLRAFAQLECNGRAPHAPAPACDQAIYAICAYLFDRPSAPSGGSYANAWYNSGASEMLRRWTQRRALLLDPSEDGTAVEPAPAPSGAGLDVAEVLALIAPWAREGNIDRMPIDKLPQAYYPTAYGWLLTTEEIPTEVPEDAWISIEGIMLIPIPPTEGQYMYIAVASHEDDIDAFELGIGGGNQFGAVSAGDPNFASARFGTEMKWWRTNHLISEGAYVDWIRVYLPRDLGL